MDTVSSFYSRQFRSAPVDVRSVAVNPGQMRLLHKPAIVEEEADENLSRLKLLAGLVTVSENKFSVLRGGIDEIVDLTGSSIKMLRSTKLTNLKSKNLTSEI